MHDKTDGQLVEMARQDTMAAFQHLVERYKKKIYYTAISVLGNHYDAEDVLQETVLAALRSLEKLRQPQGFGSWVLRIAYNKSIDTVRKRKREVSADREDKEGEFFDRIESNSPFVDPERVLDSDRLGTAVRGIVDRLPSTQKNAFMMKHVAHLSIKEIADATNSTEATVKTNIYRAVQKLRKELAPFVQANAGFDGAINPGAI